jgi:tetratricopeptide (TPR) repeat protein
VQPEIYISSEPVQQSIFALARLPADVDRITASKRSADRTREGFMAGRTFLLLVVFVIPAAAQFDSVNARKNPHVRFHIAYSSGSCQGSTKIELMQAMTSVARGVADKNCTVDLFDVPTGSYRLVISCPGFSAVASDEITLNTFETEPIEVQVPQTRLKSGPVRSSISVSDLRIPRRAAKEFSKADREMQQQDWSSAIASLERAIRIYPQYAAAYNSLGVIYARSGDRAKEEDVLRQAIEIDSRYLPAYVNLARLHLATQNYADAETELNQAIALDPENGVVLVLLTYSEYMNHHWDEAVNSCRRVHALNSAPHASAHWTAAFALEQKNQIAEAGEQFRAFVKEQPRGDRADAARKELANIENFLSAKP